MRILSELIDHNYWARDRQLQACAALSPEQFLRPLGNSFPSVRDTLAHLVACEWGWLERWRGRVERPIEADELPTLAAVTERWIVVEREMRAFLGGLSDEELERPFSYVNSRGETWTYVLWRAVLHVMMHQNYHRGQVTMELRMLGVQPPEVDFLTAHDMGFRVTGA